MNHTIHAIALHLEEQGIPYRHALLDKLEATHTTTKQDHLISYNPHTATLDIAPIVLEIREPDNKFYRTTDRTKAHQLQLNDPTSLDKLKTILTT